MPLSGLEAYVSAQLQKYGFMDGHPLKNMAGYDEETDSATRSPAVRGEDEKKRGEIGSQMATFQPIVFGKYTLLERIGVNPMAEVYRASHLNNPDKPQPVLIKRFLPHVTKNKKLVECLSNTARVTSRFDHENVAGVLDFGSVEDVFYIAIEYLSGYPLQHLLTVSRERQRPFTPQHALHIAAGICRALDYAHGFKDPLGRYAAVIHGNLSPDSVFITFDGTVKLTDFGIHKENTRETGAQPEGLNTRLSYMSPEQITGEPCDSRTDIFSTGILLYEMLTGRRMFQGKSMEIFSMVRHARFEPVEKAAPQLPAALPALLEHCLQKAQDDRYPSAGEMLKALDEARSALPEPTFDHGLSIYFDSHPIQGTPKNKAKRASRRKTAAPIRPKQENLGTAGKATPTEKGIREAPPAQMAKPPSPPVATVEKAPPPTEPTPKARPRETARTGSASKAWLIAVPAAVAVVVALVLIIGRNSDWGLSLSTAPSPSELALQALDQGNFSEAILGFEKALAARPQDLDKLKEPYAQALEEQAARLLKTDPATAEGLLLQANQLAPDRVGVHATLGLLYLNRKEYRKATGAYRRAIRLNPQMADLFFNLGYIYAVQRDFPKAHEMYARTVELSPPFIDEALFNLAMIEARQGKRETCVKNLRRALKHNPDNEQVREYLKQLET